MSKRIVKKLVWFAKIKDSEGTEASTEDFDSYEELMEYLHDWLSDGGEALYISIIKKKVVCWQVAKYDKMLPR